MVSNRQGNYKKNKMKYNTYNQNYSLIISILLLVKNQTPPFELFPFRRRVFSVRKQTNYVEYKHEK